MVKLRLVNGVQDHVIALFPTDLCIQMVRKNYLPKTVANHEKSLVWSGKPINPRIAAWITQESFSFHPTYHPWVHIAHTICRIGGEWE